MPAGVKSRDSTPCLLTRSREIQHPAPVMSMATKTIDVKSRDLSNSCVISIEIENYPERED